MAGYQLYYSIPNLALWAERFAKAPQAVVEVLNEALAKSAVLVEGAAKKNAPVQSGRLRSSIRSKVEPLRAIIYTDVEYAEFVHQGTGVYGPHRTPIVPLQSSVLRFQIDGETYWRKSVKGQKAQPFMSDAYEESKDEIIAFFTEANNAYVRSLGGKE